MTVQSQEPIAIVGMACRFPGGSNSPSKLWELLRAPRDLSKRVPTDRFDVTAFHHANGSYHGATDAQQAYFLDEDVTRFDNGFFNIPAAEAEAMDPQQRLLMETVYDSLCAGGQTIEGLRGSKTAVYVGLMCDDWAQLIARDWDQTPTYAATGDSRAILSNRVSYFFDWRGPSMTIDTACSSSLVAVHQGVTALRNGECPVAIAAGANLIMAPGMFIGESKLHMLSPTGSSKMWDAAADGYARGEGIAAVVMKPLSAALRDGDHIDCIIRGVAVNQDGKTVGLTVPSNKAQAALIRDAYARAGLDINNAKDRPQFFHAHGTGTPAGDPQEAEAISRSFFGDCGITDKLYVGSIKTIIGHTEGAAGLASLIGSVMAMQQGIIPPNLHFENLSARVAPHYKHLEVPTTAKPWPTTLPGQPRRVSVNSFGFGGTNAHAILEYPLELDAQRERPTASPVSRIFSPFTVSATSPSALRSALSDLKTYLEANPETSISDLAYTLQTRRSTLAYRKPVVAATVDEAIKRIGGLLESGDANANGLNTRYHDVSKPNILGVFTGQGAQWPRMGARLIEESPFAAQRLAELQRALATLPGGDRPSWSLRWQLLAASKSSRVAEAAISQPLCTAVQIVLIDLLKAAGIQLSAVVGHSSGEIAAAYAAGFLSATDAIRIAYYRGMVAGLAASPDSGCRGAMMAVGTSFEDAEEFCELDDFVGRIQVAARNSPTSITLSGDDDAIEEAVAIFKDEGKFARRLNVDTAYHSAHMLACEEHYLAGLARAGYTAGDGSGVTAWFSSVIGGGSHIMTKEDVQNPRYWADNMTHPVLFAPAVAAAVGAAGPFDMAIEIGPHPALKGPALETIDAAAGQKIPYTGLLGRNKDDTEELSSALGTIWCQLGASSVNFEAFENLISGTAFLPKECQKKQVLAHLPGYPFDHSRSFYALTRFSGVHRHMHAPPHPLLGRQMVETETADTITWRNLLRPSEISWIQGHALQGQSVFPAMGFVSMAVEAVSVAAGGRKLGLVTLSDLEIGRALAFSDENVGMEVKITLTMTRLDEHAMFGCLTCHSGLPLGNGATPLALNFRTNVSADFHEPTLDTLPAAREDELNLVEAVPHRLYSQFTSLGYNYSVPFTGVRTIRRKKGWATGEIEDEAGDGWEDRLLVHPGWLDSAVQTGFAAYTHPQDNRLHTLLVPTAIRSIVINPYFFDLNVAATTSRHRPTLLYQTTARVVPDAPMAIDIDLFSGCGDGDAAPHAFVQFDSLKVSQLAASTARDDSPMFSRFHFDLAAPDVETAVRGEELVPRETAELWKHLDRIGLYYLRRLYNNLTPAERDGALPYHRPLLEYTGRLLGEVASGKCAAVLPEALNDSAAFIRSLMARYCGRADMDLAEAISSNIAAEIRHGGGILEQVVKDGLLDRFYEDGIGIHTANGWISRVVAQIAHRYPRMHLLEVGAGASSATRPILSALRGAFSNYTVTDVDADFLSRARDKFMDYEHLDRMSFATFDAAQPPEEQGFTPGSYDVIVAPNVLHATGKLDDVLAHVRRLLRPGGYLVVLEIVSENTPFMNLVWGGMMTGWWVDAMNDPARRDGPCLSLDKWDALTRRHGFDGIDTHVPVLEKTQWFSAFVCQAVDHRVDCLRAPLAFPQETGRLQNNSNQLVIIGGRTPAIGKLARDAASLLRQHYATVIQLKHPEELNKFGLDHGSSVLSLAELEEQFMETRSESKLEALKTLLRNASSILWVTRCARNENPFSSIIIGLSRVARLEYPNVNMQLFDFDAATEATPQRVAEAILRLELGVQFAKESNDLLWTVEPEMHYQNGKLLIPRLMKDVPANRRYNTYRRPVLDDINLDEGTVVLEPAPGATAFELAAASPLRIPPAPPRTAGGKITLRVEQSLLQVVKVGNAGYLTLILGRDIAKKDGGLLVALADTVAESRTTVPVEWTARVPDGKPSGMTKNVLATTLVTAGAHLVARSILATAPRFGTLLVHEADELLKNTLDREAAWEGVRVVFTTATKAKIQKARDAVSAPYVLVHDKLSLRQAQALLPRDISFLVNLGVLDSKGDASCSKLFSRILLPHTAAATTADFICTQPQFYPDADVEQVGRTLKAAWQATINQQRRTPAASAALLKNRVQQEQEQHQAALIPLQDVTGVPAVHAGLTTVDWTASSSVRALLRPIDHGTIFRADGTYILAGLTGDLGQSICTWMVEHGARHVVLSSRRPKVEPRFIESLATAHDAVIRPIAMDVTRRESLRAAVDTIRAEMPPIVGVVNGAMLLEDMLFEDLDMASLERTAPPKIDGSVLLDELFYDAPLDFFILMTSAAQIVGNGGQSAYVMENQFMNALAAQRRDVRGVAGSNMAISFVNGLGYFEHAHSLDIDHFLRLSYHGISERDVHELFAETILAGRPENRDAGVSEVATGISPFPDVPETHIQLRANPRFNHFLLHDAAAGASRGLHDASGKMERPRARLAAVKSHDEARTVVREAFMDQLRRILMLSPEGGLDEKASFIESGVDSIMAVEIRSWFLKELDVDVPVLKILGAGSTLATLVDEVMDRIPADVLSLDKAGDGPVAAPAPVPAPAKASPPRRAVPAVPALPVIATPTPPFSKTPSETSTTDTATPTPPFSKTPSETAATDTATETSRSVGSSSPRAISAGDTPPKTPLESLAGLGNAEREKLSIQAHKQQITQVLEKEREKARRKAIIDSSTEVQEPMTYGQKRFWFLYHYVEDRTAFNIAYQFRLEGRIRAHDLSRVVDLVVQRHEALRTRYFWSVGPDGTKTPMQGILSKGLVCLETATIESEAQAVQELIDMRNLEWDLGDWGQLRLRLLSLSDNVHYLVMSAHHISLDGHSLNVLMSDLNQAYRQAYSLTAPLPDASQARAFGKHQMLAYTTGKLQPAINFYRSTLAPVDLTRPIAVFPFARSQVRRPLDRYANTVARARLPAETAARLKQLARMHRATSFHGYLAALQSLIFRLLPQAEEDAVSEHVVIGVADANRVDAKFLGSVGNFLNILPLVFNRHGKMFGTAIEEARDKVYGALEHSHLPFDILLDELAVPRSNTYPPLCQILVDYKLVTREQAEMKWVGCKVNGHEWFTAKSTYDVAIEIVEDDESALVVVHMQEALYSREAAELFLRSYVNLLDQVANRGGEKVGVDKLEKWDGADVRKGLELGKGPDMPLEWPATVAHRVDQIIAQYPDNIAVKDGFGNAWSYAALDEQVEQIARILRTTLPDQSSQQSVVGVFQTPAADWIASILAIMRVGAVYLPLDLKVSVARLKGYIRAARPAAILADSVMIGLAKDVDPENSCPMINLSDLPAALHGNRNQERMPTAAHPQRPAYIIFTSGSTGEPKGVVIKHASFRTMAESYVRQWDMASRGGVVLQQFPLTSDGSLKQIVSAITTGGCLVVAPAEARGDPTELTRLMADHQVTCAVATPSEWSMWFRFASESLRRCTALTSAWFGGEVAPQSLLDSFRDLGKTLPGLSFFNTYGPTEATISTAKGEADVRNNQELHSPVPIRTLPNYAVYIVDDKSDPVPLGVPGEIIIGGAGVGKNEYLDRAELTAERFPADPYAPSDKLASGWGRMYRTGDYGRLDARGMLTVEGRIAGDAQVKIRGFRVELGEIEGVILREVDGALAAAVVTLRNGGDGDHDGLLVAHVVMKDPSKPLAEILSQLRSRLALSLPQYMVPAVIVPMDEVPLTSNGKVDRNAIRALPLPQTAFLAEDREEDLTPAERRLADIWATVLPSQSLSALTLTSKTDFFRAGGNSLLLVKLQSAIKKAFGGDAPRLNTLMGASELGSMAMLLAPLLKSSAEAVAVAAAPNWNEEIALESDLAEATRTASQGMRGTKNRSSATGLRVLVTGATGLLGKTMIPQLVADPRVAQITILARPAEGRDLTSLFPSMDNSDNKIHVLATELPVLPSSDAPELQDIDIIVHVAADRNFWDGYTALKPVNVDTVKALARLALRTNSALHFLSSGAVADFEADGDNPSRLPRPDPAFGYAASKWVAERYLANAARQAGLRVTAHRPARKMDFELAAVGDQSTEIETALAKSIMSIAPVLGVQPDFEGVGGTMHIAPVEEVAAAVLADALTAADQDEGQGMMRVVDHPAQAVVRTQVVARCTRELLGREENAGVGSLPMVPVLKWVGMAKRRGVFGWFFASQELVVTDEEGREVVSRR